MTDKTYSIEALSDLTGIPVRTIRFYIQTGLAERPEGQGRAARYLDRHLERLLLIKRLTAEGRSLASVKSLIDGGAESAGTPSGRSPGEVSVRFQVHLADGIELLVDPARAGLSSQALRSAVPGILELIENLRNTEN